MKLAFFGSPDFAAKILAEIHKKFPVSFVVSQKDKPVGRKQIFTPTPVTNFARNNNIPVFNNLSINRFIDIFEKEKVDLAIVAAYGKIIPKELLNKAKFGFWNIHYSLLPKYRGASPVQFAILNNERETGVTIFKIDEKLDHGPIYDQVKQNISPRMTAGELIEDLTKISIQPVTNLIAYIKKESKLPKLTEQDYTQATYTRILTKNDGFIPFATLQKIFRNENLTLNDLPKIQQEIIHTHLQIYKFTNLQILIYNFIRALNPWPTAWTILPNGKRLKIYKSHLEDRRLILDEVQLEGRNITSDSKFINRFIK